MLIHEYDSVAGLVARPSDEAIEIDRQRQLDYVQDLIHRLTENQRVFRVNKVNVARRVAAA
jgi:hypothetical protein